MLSRMNLVEKAGTGILRIRSAMKEYKLEVPKIETDDNWFTITFKRPDLQKESYEQRFYSKISPKKSPRKVPEKYQKIIAAIKENPYLSRKELSLKLGESEETIQSRLRKLSKEGLIKRIGPDKGGHWEILQ